MLAIGTLAHASLGFGTALVSMPPLVLMLGFRLAVPLVALLALTNTALLLVRGARDFDLHVVWRLLLASVIGIPLGLVLLRTAPEYLVKGILGVTLIAYGLYNVNRPQLPYLPPGPWIYPFGLIAGILGGAYNTYGPPIVLYGALSRWPPQQFQATLQAYFLPTSIMICAGHAAADLWSVTVFKLYAAAIPCTLVAMVLGLWLGRRIPAERFTRLLYLALTVLGAALLL